MTERHDVSIEDVRLLVAERQRYDDWLAALEARRAETPARVFERVYGDYVGRRSGVLEQLRGHVETLATLGHDLETRIGALEEQLAAHEDERAEAILRTAVGEYDGDRWESVRQDVELKIGTLSEQRGALMTEVDDVRTLLASARPEPAEPEPTAPEPAAAASLAAEEVDVSAEPATSSTVVTGHTEDGAVEPVLELAPAALPTPSHVQAARGVESVPLTDATSAHATPISLDEWLTRDVVAPATAASTAPQPSVAAEPDGEDFDDALALFSTEPRVAPTERESVRPRAFDSATPGPADALLQQHGLPGAANSSGARNAFGVAPQPVSAEPAPAPTRDTFDDLAFLRSVIDPAAQGTSARSSAASEQQKTLRCTECGTMNFPTEWYCERCGGELAAF
jgi:hypothetical protein